MLDFFGSFGIIREHVQRKVCWFGLHKIYFFSLFSFFLESLKSHLWTLHYEQKHPSKNQIFIQKNLDAEVINFISFASGPLNF